MVSAFATESADEVLHLKNGTEISVKYRPYMHEFLEDMTANYELIVYSTFKREQVKAIVDSIEKRRKYFSYRFHDEFCLFANLSSGVKCLDFLYSGRSPADIILVDTRVKKLPLSVDNFVPVTSYNEEEPSDMGLIRLAAVLDKLAATKNVATAIKGYRTSCIPGSTTI